jgi:ABC-2 type transport system ATP-binding protein
MNFVTGKFMHNVLKASGLTKRYGKGKPVIENFSHMFRPGTVTGLIGPNGSGKTTLLRLLTTAAFPSSGTVHYGDLNIHDKPSVYLAKIGIAFDSHDLPQYVNGVELLEAVLRSRSKWTEKSPVSVDDILQSLGMDERRYNLIGTYSSGMMQKILISAALITSPEVLFLDEPFRALDEPSRLATVDLLINYKNKGGTILISSHLKMNLDKFCDDFIHFPQDSAGNFDDNTKDLSASADN